MKIVAVDRPSIGTEDAFRMDGVDYIAVDGPGKCDACAFRAGSCGLLPPCSPHRRRDGRNTHFVAVNAAGQTPAAHKETP